ncbi:amino acid permease [Lentibacter algarum]|uniref:APC family permease n=1 Tax=Lentibacter algarum TaxID=576131 RepID=UPI001C09C967|nr:amino acid permease [Lentibacter algarum]MBU2982875.1 amino acid permease [Lentibacter algarum]
MADELKRKIGLKLLTAYGVGVMVGAGIYVLVGAVAAEAGVWAPLAFLISGLIAAPTALSYAEFSTRIPEAAGEAAYVGAGFGKQGLAVFVGFAIVLAGTVSAAAVLRGGAGYLIALTGFQFEPTIMLMGVALILVALAGVLESLTLAAIFTVVEVIGLGFVVYAGLSSEAQVSFTAPEPVVWGGIASAAVLAFFAFIGFEDIVNMAEEVQDPTHVLPRAILYSLLITSVLYAFVAYAAVRAVPLEVLAKSEQPLALVWTQAYGGQAAFLSAIAVAAALNGVLAQIVMASRVLFGLGKRNAMMAIFHHAHRKWGTPVLATALVGLGVMGAALVLPVAELAEIAAGILLSVFVLVNAALIVLKRSKPDAPFRVSMAVPVFGLVASLAALAVTIGANL